MNRRQWVKTAVSGTAFGGVLLAVASEKGPKEKIIDIHQHVNFSGRLNKELIAHQDLMGIHQSVLLPSGTALARASTHEGKSNGLAARVFGTEASARLAADHPDKFVYFCNEVPDKSGAVQELEKWLKRNARGIGEQKFHLDCDSAPMQRVYEVAREFQVPVLLHFEHERYNMGFERFHKMLEKYSTVNFIGHAQTFWGNIDAKHQQEVMYPKGKVTPGGITDRYLSDYPNMYGDLSAGSGRNALDRDREHAAAFLDRHQNKLCLGTDCSDRDGQGAKCSGSNQIANVRELAPDEAARKKILFDNAHKIIRL